MLEVLTILRVIIVIPLFTTRTLITANLTKLIRTSTRMQTKADIVIYALGGGMGHLIRGCAIANVISELEGVKPTVLAPPGFVKFFKGEQYQLKVIPPPHNPSKYRLKILKTLEKLNSKVLVVDALPMGLMGEMREYLPSYNGKAVLIARMLRKDYRKIMAVDDFVRAHYDVVIRSEALANNFLSHSRSYSVPPILAVNPKDVLGKKEARKQMGINEKDFLVIIVGTDTPERTDAFFGATATAISGIKSDKVTIRFASPYGMSSPQAIHTSYFPLMRLLPAADLVIGNAGYHLYHECCATGVKALLFPRPRLYDDQESRVKNRPLNINLFFSPEELKKKAEQIINDKHLPVRGKKSGFSGAQKASKIISKFF